MALLWLAHCEKTAPSVLAVGRVMALPWRGALVLQKGQVVLAGSAEEVAGSAALAGFLGV